MRIFFSIISLLWLHVYVLVTNFYLLFYALPLRECSLFLQRRFPVDFPGFSKSFVTGDHFYFLLFRVCICNLFTLPDYVRTLRTRLSNNDDSEHI